jgi:hypothetical protein
VPLNKVSSFFQVGAVNRPRNGSNRSIIDVVHGTSVLLGEKIDVWQLLSYSQDGPAVFFLPKIVQSRAYYVFEKSSFLDWWRASEKQLDADQIKKSVSRATSK